MPPTSANAHGATGAGSVPAVTQEGLAAIRDCVDAVLACDRQDPLALAAVVARIRNAHGAFTLLAAITGGLLADMGLRGAAAEKALRDVARRTADGLLDLASAEEVSGHS